MPLENEEEPDEQAPLLSAQRPRNDGAEDVDGDQQEWSNTRLIFTMLPIYFGVFVNALDSTIVATLSAPISNEFHSFTLVSWLASAFLIANAGFQPITGKLSDILGRRAILVSSLIVFATGNLVCGLAKNERVIITGRVIAGIGGGCVNTVATVIQTDLIPLRKRGVWQGIANICFGLGAAVGGIFGGWMHDQFNWRWAFLIQVPCLILATLLVILLVRIPQLGSDKSRLQRIDFLGAFTLVTSLVLLLLGIDSGGNLVPWRHPLVYISLPLAALLLIAFVLIEERVPEPVLPVRLLLNRTVAAACTVNLMVSMAYYGYLYYTPIFFQIKGYSASRSGAQLIPNAIGISIGSLGSGLIMRTTGRYYWLSVSCSLIFTCACALLLAFFNLDTPIWSPYIALFLGGLGVGGLLTTTLVALVSAVDREHHAVITSASYAARSTGSVTGIAIAGAVFQNLLKSRLWLRLGGEKHAAQLISELRDDVGALAKLGGSLKRKALLAYIESLRGVWATLVVMAAVGVVAAICIRQHTLHATLARR